ncbi:MAG TPA: DUF4124 domain-containing protein [Burkholderiales bacterium]|nr:DUF4124 domain-containing protein [Burkholderiales bacterium]
MRFLLALLLVLSAPAHAQVYRWVDARGTVHYSNTEPPPSVKARKLDIDARPGPAAADSEECHTVRCQGERMEGRQARRDVLDAQLTAERVALAPPQARGLEFRKYISIQRGMSEGELLAIAGPPDHQRRDRLMDRLTYMPTTADPFVTTITLVRGRVTDVERNRKF